MESYLPASGISRQPSVHSVEETVRSLQTLLEARGVKLFALIDHSGEAEKVGMHMPATKLLIFGNPKAGTPVMLAAPTAALDLPLKLLVSEDNAGDVWIYYNSAGYLQQRHGFGAEFLPTLGVVEALAKAAGS